jgi:hypothetical protein
LLIDQSASPWKLVVGASPTTILWRRWHPLVRHGSLFLLLTREHRGSDWNAVSGDHRRPVMPSQTFDSVKPTWLMTHPQPHLLVCVTRSSIGIKSFPLWNRKFQKIIQTSKMVI